MNINRLFAPILLTISALFLFTPSSSAQDILATKRAIVKLMKAVHEREMVVQGSNNYWWLPEGSRLDAAYNATTIWRRYLPSAPYGYDATHRDPDLNWLDNEAYLLDTRYITDLYNTTKNLVGHYYKYDPDFAPLYFTDFTIEELPPTEEPSIALQSIADTLKKLEWVKLKSLKRGVLSYDGANWDWIWGNVYEREEINGNSNGYQGSYEPLFISLVVPQSLESDLSIIFHFTYVESCDPQGQCYKIWWPFAKGVSIEQSGIAVDGTGGCPNSSPQDIPVDVKIDIHEIYPLESPDDVYGENIWSHDLTNASENYYSSVDCIKWGGIAGRYSWYGYSGDEWTWIWTSPSGWTRRRKDFYNKIDMGSVDNDFWVTLYQEPLILRQSYPQDIQPTETSAGRWYRALAWGRLTLDRITAKIKFEYPGEISFVTAREEWCGDGCLFPRIEIGSSANLSNGNMYDSIEISNITLSYNSLLNYTGPLGNNWTHNYNIYLESISSTSITFLDEDGTSIKFTDDNNDGIYESEARFWEHSTIIKNNDGTYTLIRKYGMIYYFNSDGKLTRIENRNGNVQSLSYAWDNLTTITDSVGRLTTLTYNTDNRISQIRDPGSRVTEVYYDTNGNLIQIKNPQGNSWIYTHDNQNRLISKQDPEGNLYHYSYDDEGRLTSATDPDNNTISIQYIPENNQAIITDPLGYQTVYTYDKALNVWTGITDPLGNTVTKTWDENRNNLTSIDAVGNTTTNTYDERGNLLTTADVASNITTYIYEPVYNQVLAETDPLNNTTTYEYDTEGNRVKTIDALGQAAEYTYDTKGNLLTTKDALGNITTNTYDQYGNIESTTNPLGDTTTYTYDINGNMLSSTDPKGDATTYEYNVLSQLTAVIDVLGNLTSYTYDANGNRTTITDASDNTTQYQYDNQNRLIKAIDPQGNETIYTYDSNDNRIGAKDPEGNITTNVYDAVGRLISTTDTEDNTTIYSYDAVGNRTSIIDPEGNTTTSTYDSLNRLMTTTDAQGNQTRYTYDAVGRVLSSTLVGEGGGEGLITAYTYDALGRTTSIQDPAGGTTSYTYDAIGNRTSITDPLGRTTHYTYDAVGKTVSTTDPEGNTTRYEYDCCNLIAVIDSLGNTTNYEYDTLNRLTSMIDPQGARTTYEYDSLGNRISVTDPQGRITRYEYDKNNRLIAIIDPQGNRTEYQYDRRGNKIAIIDSSGRITEYEYNSLNQLIAIIEPSGAITIFTYDNRGNVTSKTDPNGNTIRYEYNSLNQMIKRIFPDGYTDTFTYDPYGNQLTKDSSEIQTRNTYDNLSRLISKTENNKTISYKYDRIGNRTEMTDPLGGMTIFAYDQNNRLVSLTDPDNDTTKFEHDSLGRRAKRILPNGCYTTYTYDNKSQLITLSNYSSSGAVRSFYSYTRDLSGNITQVTETTQDSTKTITYSYDTLYQLTNTTITEPKKDTVTFTYIYDITGNRTSLSISKTGKDENLPFKELHPTLDKQPFIQNPLTINYTYNNADQLTQEKATRLKNNEIIYQTTYNYDNNGNTITKNLTKGKDTYKTTYQYDYNNMMRQINYPEGITNTFRNSTDGDKRFYKQDSTGETHYYFDTIEGLDHILIEYDETDNPKTIFTHSDRIDEPISRKYKTDDGTWKKEYYLYDGHGSVRQLVDEKGGIIGSYTYEPFGLIIDWQGGESLKNPITYTGREYDKNSGLYQYRPRYMNPWLGIFTTPDPILRQPSIAIQNISATPEHPYVYVKNNPVNFTDPTGLVSITQLNTLDIRMEPGGIGRTDVDIYYYYRRSTDINNPRCCKIKFMQITRKNSEQWFVDGNPWYPNQKPYDYGDPAPQNEYAKMEDRPGGWWLLPSTIQEFETCAICVSGSDKGINYGGISWGHLIEFGRVVRVWPGTKSGLRPEAPSYTFRILTGY